MGEDKLYNKVLDDLISYAGPIAIEEMANDEEESGKENGLDKIEFSKEHQLKMKKLFRKEYNKLRLRKIASYSKYAIACILVLAIIVLVPIFSVKAWRIKFLNFIIDVKQTHTEIKFSDDVKTGDTYQSEEISFGYIPAGSKMEKSDRVGSYIYIKFKANEQYFTFSRYDINAAMSIDTENATVKKITINNREALYSSNSNINILVWHDDNYSYNLSGNIDENEIIKIVENIKIKY